MQEEEVKKRVITIEVDGIRHGILAPYSDEAHYRYAAEELQTAVRIYRKRYPDQSEIPQASYLSMAAIDVAYRARLTRLRLEARDWLPRLAALNDELETLLFSPTSGH